MLLSAVSAFAQTTTFQSAAGDEVIAAITVNCARCAWDVEGREAVVFAVRLDDRAPVHLPVVRSGRAEYRVMLGPAAAGPHAITIDEDPALTARELRGSKAASVEQIKVEQIPSTSPQHRALAMAPIIYARPNTVGRFTDVPVFMYYEIEKTPAGQRYRYTVIFTNEDGGTPADRLMATWGRTTDIEYVYSVALDGRGAIIDEDMQGPEHEILPFRGRREGQHPLLWVSTENNMVLDRGETAVRYAPAPALDATAMLRTGSREVVMDTHAWLYEVMTRELQREGKVVPGSGPQKGVIPDPRTFAYVQACGELGTAALAIDIGTNSRVTERTPTEWFASDRGVPAYRVARDGCFRIAVPLRPGMTASDVRAIRVRAHSREGKASQPVVRLTHVNRLLFIGEDFRVHPLGIKWEGPGELKPDGPPLVIPYPAR